MLWRYTLVALFLLPFSDLVAQPRLDSLHVDESRNHLILWGSFDPVSSQVFVEYQRSEIVWASSKGLTAELATDGPGAAGRVWVQDPSGSSDTLYLTEIAARFTLQNRKGEIPGSPPFRYAEDFMWSIRWRGMLLRDRSTYIRPVVGRSSWTTDYYRSGRFAGVSRQGAGELQWASSARPFRTGASLAMTLDLERGEVKLDKYAYGESGAVLEISYTYDPITGITTHDTTYLGTTRVLHNISTVFPLDDSGKIIPTKIHLGISEMRYERWDSAVVVDSVTVRFMPPKLDPAAVEHSSTSNSPSVLAYDGSLHVNPDWIGARLDIYDLAGHLVTSTTLEATVTPLPPRDLLLIRLWRGAAAATIKYLR